MKIKLLNTELFIKANKLKEVTNPVTLDRGSIPTVDGLLSTEIFGTSPAERKRNYAYISLNGHFLQPIVYKQIKRLDKRIDFIIGGTKKFSIDKSGNIVEDEGGSTGIEWLYENWDKIKWRKNSSEIRSERIDLITDNPRDIIFTKYFLVEPAFYRDINLQKAGTGNPSLHEINVGSDQTNGSSYAKLIRLCLSLRTSGTFAFALNNTKFQIQLCMVDIYNYFKSRIEKKFGIIKKGIMGKSVDYGSRLVISSSHTNTEHYDETICDIEHCGLPLANCVSNAVPFFVGWLSDFFRREFEATGNKYPVYDPKTKTVSTIEVKNPSAYFNDAYCTMLMNKFIFSYNERFDPIEIPNNEGRKLYMAFKGRVIAPQKEIARIGETKRYMTLTDLMFIAAVNIYKDKHVIITRYPITSFQSLYPIKVNPLTTQETCTMDYGGTIYKFYPIIDLTVPKDQVALQFINVLHMQNTLLGSLGADYDGDTVSVRAVFTQEGNLDCERMMKEPTQFLNANGTNIRTTTNEAINTLYVMTKE